MLVNEWVKSSRCKTKDCVEVRRFGDVIQIRDSQHPDREPLSYTPAEWEAFCAGVDNGEFDL